MPNLYDAAATAAASHAIARRRAQTHHDGLASRAAYTTAQTPLQQALFDAVARARKVAAREPHLITTFALSDRIEAIETRASACFAAGEIDAYTALYAVARELTALIPVR